MKCNVWRKGKQMKSTVSETTEPTSNYLGHFGLATLICFITLPVFALTIFFPPWFEVHCQRREILYWSERVTIHHKSFAGFDYLLASKKWQIVKPTPVPASGLFESKEFGLAWPILFMEWIIVSVVAGICYYRISRQVFQTPRKVNKPHLDGQLAEAEQQ